MNRLFAVLLTLLLLTSCAANTSSNVSSATTSSEVTSSAAISSVSVSSVTSTDTQSITSTHSIPSTVSGIDTVSSPAKIIEGQNSLVGYGKVVLSGNIYTVEVMQTRYLKPIKEPKDYSEMFLTAVYGNFDVVIKDNSGKEKNRIALKQLCDGEIGFPAIFDIYFLKDEKQTKCLFGIFCSNVKKNNIHTGGDKNYIMLSLDDTGKLMHVPVDTEYFYTVDMNDLSIKFHDKDTINHISVPVFWDKVITEAEYVWDGSQYVLRKS